jgi:hypothetical protein
MTGKQTAVLWLGVGLILVRLFATGQWGSVWSVIGGGTKSGSGGESPEVKQGVNTQTIPGTQQPNGNAIGNPAAGTGAPY